MEQITAFKCRCGTIYEDKESIRKCTSCGKEICDDCAGFVSLLCWGCNENHVEERVEYS
jgi:hypothetical protein